LKPALAIILGSFLGLTLGLGLYTFVYDIKAAKDAGASDAELAEARQWQRRAQFKDERNSMWISWFRRSRWDFTLTSILSNHWRRPSTSAAKGSCHCARSSA